MTIKIYTAKYGDIENVIHIETEWTREDIGKFISMGEIRQEILNENGKVAEVICHKLYRG